MTEQLLLYLTDRSDGEATFEVIPDVEEGQEAEVYMVTVSDEEPDDVFGPIIQRAVEEAGYNFYIGDWTGREELDGPAFTVTVPEGVTRKED